MHIIPVIDVKGGVAVRARAGNRDSYMPLVTPLSASADPLDVALGYLASGAFTSLYVADLDGIEKRGANLDLVGRLTTALPATELWIDNGAADAGSVSALTDMAHVTVVIGSETGIGPDDLANLSSRHPGRIVLSLDFRGSTFLGHPSLLEAADHWPDRVIAMTLARVGVGQGPDLERIAATAVQAGRGRRVYAAGGIRDAADLDAARAAGASGALVATALHSGAITTAVRPLPGRA